ncbi:hypothetical protein HanIR_Chr02g0062101 [Helianthus annuus]|nr:hypothetical protein HanIR_Chr02g0062101 [Helianthus annuus]
MLTKEQMAMEYDNKKEISEERYNKEDELETESTSGELEVEELTNHSYEKVSEANDFLAEFEKKNHVVRKWTQAVPRQTRVLP